MVVFLFYFARLVDRIVARAEQRRRGTSAFSCMNRSWIIVNFEVLISPRQSVRPGSGERVFAR